VNIRQSEVMPLVFVRQPCVIDSQAMQDRRVEVEYRNRIARDVVAEVICFADGHARLDACPCKKSVESNFGEGPGKSDQTPEYSPIRNSGHDTGDFVFIRRK
jgi:hypothetical protein